MYNRNIFNLKMLNYSHPYEYNNNKEISSPMVAKPEVIGIQTTPNSTEIGNLQAALRSKTCFVYCPYCQKQNLTRVDSRKNMIDAIICGFTVGTVWCLLHLVRGKDLNCENSDHYCSKCNKKLGDYSAC